MNRIKYFLLSLIVCLSTTFIHAQDDDKVGPYKRPDSESAKDTINPSTGLKTFEKKKKFDIGKMLIEPNVQLYFQQNYIQFGLMPSVGYKVWKELYVGGSLNYNITYINNFAANPLNTSTSLSGNVQVFGGGPFAHYKIYKGFFARVRLEMLAVRYPKGTYVNNDIAYDTRGVPYIWTGAGYNLTASRNFFIPLAIYVNPLYAAYGGDVKTTTQLTSYTSWFYLQIAFYIISPQRR